MGALALLAGLALSPEIQSLPRAACDLSPSYGRGQSSEGRIDEAASLGFGCSFRAYTGDAWSLWPRLSLNEQRWTLYRDAAGLSTLQNFQTRDIGLGLQVSYQLSGWDVFFGLQWSRGQGQLERTDSRAASRQSALFSQLDHTRFQQELGVQRPINQNLSLKASLVHASGKQSWDADAGRFEGENVDSENRLTLTSIPEASLTSDTFDYASWEIKVGLSLKLL